MGGVWVFRSRSGLCGVLDCPLVCPMWCVVGAWFYFCVVVYGLVPAWWPLFGFFEWPVPGMWAFDLIGLYFDVMLFWIGLYCFAYAILSGGRVGLMPLSYIFRGGGTRFSFFLGAFGFLFCS